MTCRAGRDFGTRHHRCECRAAAGHAAAHECRCGRSWWNNGTPPPTPEPLTQVDGYAYVEGKGYVRHGKAHAYEALGLRVEWGTHQTGKDNRILQYKDDTTEGA